MDAILYYFLLPFIYGISILPFWLLHLLSDVMYFGVYHLFGYRRKVVENNLRNAFPEKTDKEIGQISRQFYHFLCDTILETFKELTISEKTLNKRLTYEGFEEINAFHDKGQSTVLVMGHFGNWELGGLGISLNLKSYMDVIYHPLRNPYFDQLLYSIRTRFGMRLTPMKSVLRYLLQHREEITTTVFVGDQTPPPNQAHWIRFLNQNIGVFPGTAKIAKKFSLPIFYASVVPKRRSSYTVKVELLIEQPQDMAEEQISLIHMRRLEQDIQQYPAYWLWSHRRWKHQLPEGMELVEMLSSE